MAAEPWHFYSDGDGVWFEVLTPTGAHELVGPFTEPEQTDTGATDGARSSAALLVALGCTLVDIRERDL